MGFFVVNGALLKCTFGIAPGSFTVLPDKMINCAGVPMANIMDFKPMVNIATFGMCQSLANPTVASATASASGVLTPMPCIPNTVAPWIPGKPTVLVKNMPALVDNCKCMCIWGGVIEVTFAGNVTVKT